MTFSAYDTSDVKVLSAALAQAMRSLKRSAARPLTEIETTDFSKRITLNLMKVFDLGERDASALNRAALEGIYASTDNR